MRRIKRFGHQNHNNILQYIILSLAVFFVLSCNLKKRKEWINCEDVESIRFWYVDKYIVTDCALTDCNDVLNMDYYKDTVIVDTAVIRRYISIINQLQPIELSSSYDLRVTSVIVLKNRSDKEKKKIPVCFDLGGKVLRNGILMQGNGISIAKFLDDVLYNHLTSYDWLPNDIKQYLEDHPEDSTKFFFDK